MTRIDHTNHGHDNTPAARAACRKAMSTGTPFTIGDQVLTPRKSSKTIREAANASRGVERDRTRAAAKVARKPRPVKATRRMDTGGCVQAELHNSPGICACGHRNGM